MHQTLLPLDLPSYAVIRYRGEEFPSLLYLFARSLAFSKSKVQQVQFFKQPVLDSVEGQEELAIDPEGQITSSLDGEALYRYRTSSFNEMLSFTPYSEPWTDFPSPQIEKIISMQSALFRYRVQIKRGSLQEAISLLEQALYAILQNRYNRDFIVLQPLSIESLFIQKKEITHLEFSLDVSEQVVLKSVAGYDGETLAFLMNNLLFKKAPYESISHRNFYRSLLFAFQKAPLPLPEQDIKVKIALIDSNWAQKLRAAKEADRILMDFGPLHSLEQCEPLYTAIQALHSFDGRQAPVYLAASGFFGTHLGRAFFSMLLAQKQQGRFCFIDYENNDTALLYQEAALVPLYPFIIHREKERFALQLELLERRMMQKGELFVPHAASYKLAEGHYGNMRILLAEPTTLLSPGPDELLIKVAKAFIDREEIDKCYLEEEALARSFGCNFQGIVMEAGAHSSFFKEEIVHGSLDGCAASHLICDAKKIERGSLQELSSCEEVQASRAVFGFRLVKKNPELKGLLLHFPTAVENDEEYVKFSSDAACFLNEPWEAIYPRLKQIEQTSLDGNCLIVSADALFGGGLAAASATAAAVFKNKRILYLGDNPTHGFLPISEKDEERLKEALFSLPKEPFAILHLQQRRFLSEHRSFLPLFASLTHEQKLYELLLLAENRAQVYEETLFFLQELVQRHLKHSEPKQNLFEAGLDSFSTLALQSEIRQSLGSSVPLPSNFLQEHPTLDKLAWLITDRWMF